MGSHLRFDPFLFFHFFISDPRTIAFAAPLEHALGERACGFDERNVVGVGPDVPGGDVCEGRFHRAEPVLLYTNVQVTVSPDAAPLETVLPFSTMSMVSPSSASINPPPVLSAWAFVNLTEP